MEFLDLALKGDLETIIKSIGYVGLFTIIFLESGVFFGFFLPGASLLFTAGLLASQGIFNIHVLVVSLGIAAILGDQCGYWFGKYVGHALFTREDSRFFKKHYATQAHIFFEKYGPKAVVLARFVPIVRTFVPIIAGVAEMEYHKFFFYNVVGGISWAVGISYLGYYLGGSFPFVREYIGPIILLIIAATTTPLFLEFIRAWRKKRADKANPAA
jgi:membrane-associated protein